MGRQGLPHKLKGEAILIPVRVVQVAQDVESFFRLEGKDSTIAVLRKRAGGTYDPQIVECCCQHASATLFTMQHNLLDDMGETEK